MGNINSIIVYNFSTNYLKWYLISIIIVLLEYTFVVILTNIQIYVMGILASIS